MTEPAFEPGGDSARHQMVQHQLRARGIADPRVLAVMERIPRVLFVAMTRAVQRLVLLHAEPLPKVFQGSETQVRVAAS